MNDSKAVRIHRLLDILAARKDRSGLSGVILINGERQPQNFKCLCGYVTQVCTCITSLVPRLTSFFSGYANKAESLVCEVT